MAIHWQVKFRSLRANTLYTVNIYDETWDDDPVELIGGAQPFVTEENNDEDFFLPVRTQTGYLRIVDMGKDKNGNPFNWRELIPVADKSRPVTLTDGSGNVMWQGFIQPQTFTGQLYKPTQEREFPLMCPLSTLGSVDVDITKTGTHTFAELIQYLLAQTGTRFSFIDFQCGTIKEWLRKKFEWENFLNIDEENHITAKYTCYDILEEVCKFWGWTCRTYKNQVLFVNPDDVHSPQFTELDYQDLNELAQGGNPQLRDFSFGYIDIDADVYASNDNKVELLQGIRKATIEADINRMDVVVDVPFDKIKDMYIANDVYDSSAGDYRHIYWLHGLFGYGESYTFDDMEIELRGGQNTRAGFLVYEYYEGDVRYKHNYSWSTSLMVRGDLANDSLVKISSKQSHNYSQGVFAISGDLFSGSIIQQYNGQGILKCRLRIGSKWWDGSQWGDSVAVFNIPIGKEPAETVSGSGSIIDNRELNGPYREYNGYGIPIGNPMGGVVEFQIVGVVLDDPHGSDHAVEFTSLRMEFVRKKNYSDYKNRSSNTYKAETGSTFRDEVSIDTIFASDDNNAFGIGIIMDPSGSYCQEVSYDYNEGFVHEHPEQHLLDRIIAHGRTTKVKSTLEMRSDEVDVTPWTFLMPAVGGDSYPVAISREWRDDVVKVTAIEP